MLVGGINCIATSVGYCIDPGRTGILQSLIQLIVVAILYDILVMSYGLPATGPVSSRAVQIAITGLSATVGTNTSNITFNTSNIATNTSNIATNTASITTNAGNIATNTFNITTNTSNITTNTAIIVTNTSNIAANTASIKILAAPRPSFFLTGSPNSTGLILFSSSSTSAYNSSNGVYTVPQTGVYVMKNSGFTSGQNVQAGLDIRRGNDVLAAVQQYTGAGSTELICSGIVSLVAGDMITFHAAYQGMYQNNPPYGASGCMISS